MIHGHRAVVVLQGHRVIVILPCLCIVYVAKVPFGLRFVVPFSQVIPLLPATDSGQVQANISHRRAPDFSRFMGSVNSKWLHSGQKLGLPSRGLGD